MLHKTCTSSYSQDKSAVLLTKDNFASSEASLTFPEPSMTACFQDAASNLEPRSASYRCPLPPNEADHALPIIVQGIFVCFFNIEQLLVNFNLLRRRSPSPKNPAPDFLLPSVLGGRNPLRQQPSSLPPATPPRSFPDPVRGRCFLPHRLVGLRGMRGR